VNRNAKEMINNDLIANRMKSTAKEMKSTANRIK